mgnify:CR=1 FL=1
MSGVRRSALEPALPEACIQAWAVPVRVDISERTTRSQFECEPQLLVPLDAVGGMTGHSQSPFATQGAACAQAVPPGAEHGQARLDRCTGNGHGGSNVLPLARRRSRIPRRVGCRDGGRARHDRGSRPRRLREGLACGGAAAGSSPAGSLGPQVPNLRSSSRSRCRAGLCHRHRRHARRDAAAGCGAGAEAARRGCTEL